MTTYDFRAAKSEMDFFLRGSKQEIVGNFIYGVRIPLNHPWLVAKGNNSLVFRIRQSGLVGKSSFYDLVP